MIRSQNRIPQHDARARQARLAICECEVLALYPFWIPGMENAEFLYNFPIILMGMVYIYFPFMLFPMELGIFMVDDEAVEAAIDLGASRWQVLKEVELPMASAGIFIGSLLVFVLSLGAMVEAQVLGGRPSCRRCSSARAPRSSTTKTCVRCVTARPSRYGC